MHHYLSLNLSKKYCVVCCMHQPRFYWAWIATPPGSLSHESESANVQVLKWQYIQDWFSAEKASLYLINTPTRIYLIQQHKRSFNVKWNNFIAFWLVHLQWGHRWCGLSSALLVVLCCTGNTLTQESPGFFLILASPRATLNSVCILLFSLLGHQCGLPTPHNPGQPNLLNHTLNMYNSRRSSANTQLY